MRRQMFFEKMRSDVEEWLYGLGIECDVVIDHSVKQNDVKLTGLRLAGERINLSPLVYLDGAYEAFVHGAPYEELLHRVVDTFQIEASTREMNTGFLQDFETVKEGLFIRVSDSKSNREWLQDKVYHEDGDLAYSYHCRVDVLPDMYTTLPVTPTLLEVWGVTAEEVRGIAENNLRKEPVVFHQIYDVIMSMASKLEPDNLYEIPQIDLSHHLDSLYMLKTESDFYGARVLMRDDVMEEIGRRFGENYYILPSSQHEVILLPISCELESDILENMVKEINQMEVEPGDRLSDTLFFYDREGQRIMAAKDYYAEKQGISKDEAEKQEAPKKERHRDEAER